MKAGDTLWFVPWNRRHFVGEEVTVTRVGRKWAEISNRHRIDIKTMLADGRGYSCPGRCYASKADHDEAMALAQAWTELRRLIEKQWDVPGGVTLNQIENAKRSLFKGSALGEGESQ